MEAVNASVHIFIFPTAVFLSVRDHQELSPAHQSAAFNLILHHCVSNHTVVSMAAYCCQQYKFSRHHRVMEACFLFTLIWQELKILKIYRLHKLFLKYSLVLQMR